MVYMHVFKYFWANTVLTACHLISMVPSVLDGKTEALSLKTTVWFTFKKFWVRVLFKFSKKDMIN